MNEIDPMHYGQLTEIDPMHYGQLTERVNYLVTAFEEQKEINKKMSAQMDELMALLNRGRGAIWLAVLIGGAAGTMGSWISAKLPFLTTVAK